MPATQTPHVLGLMEAGAYGYILNTAPERADKTGALLILLFDSLMAARCQVLSSSRLFLVSPED